MLLSYILIDIYDDSIDNLDSVVGGNRSGDFRSIVALIETSPAWTEILALSGQVCRRNSNNGSNGVSIQISHS